MKNYTITVNGNVYDVTVEENTSGASVSAPVKAAAPQAPNKGTAPVAEKPASQGAGSVKISAPMPGKVLSISASEGTQVSKGDTIVVFEAMKMENSVVAPQDGVVASIEFGVGEEFDSGAVLATMN